MRVAASCSEGESGNGGDGGGTEGGQVEGASLVAGLNPLVGLLVGGGGGVLFTVSGLAVGPCLAGGSGGLGPGEVGAVGLLAGVIVLGNTGLGDGVEFSAAGVGAGLELQILEGALPTVAHQAGEVSIAGALGADSGGVGGGKGNSDLGLHL